MFSKQLRVIVLSGKESGKMRLEDIQGYRQRQLSYP